MELKGRINLTKGQIKLVKRIFEEKESISITAHCELVYGASSAKVTMYILDSKKFKNIYTFDMAIKRGLERVSKMYDECLYF
ncbi:hypothetical protein GSQ51_17895 [Clostridioides difficile]|nr:hypothetical protein [Clostridioides difficile]NJK15961.1 hypothetical protein [Clostridioides difficile]